MEGGRIFCRISLHVLSFLSSLTDICNGVVNHTWFALSRDNGLWKSLWCRRWPSTSSLPLSSGIVGDWASIYSRKHVSANNWLKSRVQSSALLRYEDGYNDEGDARLIPELNGVAIAAGTLQFADLSTGTAKSPAPPPPPCNNHSLFEPIGELRECPSGREKNTALKRLRRVEDGGESDAVVAAGPAVGMWWIQSGKNLWVGDEETKANDVRAPIANGRVAWVTQSQGFSLMDLNTRQIVDNRPTLGSKARACCNYNHQNKKTEIRILISY